MDLDWQDESDDDQGVVNVLDFPWLSSLSNNMISLRRKEVSRERKQKWVYSSSQDVRFNRLVQMCAKKMGTDTAIDVFAKLGKETGQKEFHALIKICIENAKNTTDEDVSLEQIYKAYQILKLMRERGFTIEEATYGQFLKYLIDSGMVDEFFFFSQLIKDENPDSLPRLAYYEMILWITVNNEVKIQELCHSAMAGAASEEKSKFLEQILLALGESDRKKEFMMLLKTLDTTKVMSPTLLECIFGSLGKFDQTNLAENILLSLKSNDNGVDNISNFIGVYLTSTPSLVVEDIIERFHSLHNVLKVLPTSASYEKLIKYCCELLKVHEALNIIDKALESGVALSLETFHSILDACDQSFDFDLVHHVNLRLSSFPSLKPNNETIRRMVLLCVKMKDYEGAYRLIDNLQQMNVTPPVTVYNTILAGYLREKNTKRAMTVLKQMEDANVKPDALTYSHIIGSCQCEKDIIKFHDEMISLEIKPTKQVFMSLINAYAACGLFEKAKQVVCDKRIPVEDLSRIKSALIGALASNGHFSAALEMYEEIKESKGSLEPKAIRSLAEHFQSEGELSKLFGLLDELENSPHWIDACFWVISHCVREENFSSTVDILKKLKDKFSAEGSLDVLFDEVFCLYAEKEARNMQFGLNLLQAIKEEFGVSPSRKSLDFLLSACVNAKDSDAAFMIWKEYKIAGLPYNVLSYLWMYQSLLASGNEKSANKILNQMPTNDFHVRCIVKACQNKYLNQEAFEPKGKKIKKALSATLRLLDALKSK
ncbi:pentatricopeptide repeat-containing protein At4g21880, mitochondrial-like isoform X2 [Andrographis paniculata]|nr:pentatricopeptide repeat-containing protein At4g21880, mitochondrial-like isoform X2 [Andrographis paniculata]